MCCACRGSYTPATAQPFTAALAAAQTVLDDQDVLQDDVDAAHSALLDAMMNLRYRADKSILEQVVAAANALDLTVYEPSGVEKFNAAKTAAEEALGDENAEQDRVDAAMQGLEDAMNDLIPITVDSTPVQGDSTLTSGSSTPKTGETTPIAIGFALLALAGAGAVALKNKRRS